MIEVERKYRLLRGEAASLRSRLKRMSARLVGAQMQTDTYYSPPHESFLGQEKYLRVRENASGATSSARFEYHRPFGRYAAREYEVGVSDPLMLHYVLRQLGFIKEMVVRKHRQEWKYGGLTIEIDQVRGLGDFVELEVMGQTQRRGLRRIDSLARELGLSERPAPLGYIKMLFQKQRPAVWRKYYAKTNKK